MRCASADWAVVTGASSGIGEQLACNANAATTSCCTADAASAAPPQEAIEAQNLAEARRWSSRTSVAETARNGSGFVGLDVRLLFANAGLRA